MLVGHEAEQEFIKPVVMDSVELLQVRVLREWQHIDLVIEIETSEAQWVVVIENKVNPQQHSDQLTRYRKVAKQAYPQYERYYLLLSKAEEEPQDEAYARSSYRVVYQALSSCMIEMQSRIGADPAVLLRNYLSLLEQKFMPNTEIERLARKIYQQHQLAIDTIIENIPSPLDGLAEQLEKHRQTVPELRKMPSSRIYYRFIPEQWAHEKNLAGRAWGEGGAYILLELYLGGAKPSLKIVSGRAPVEWVEKVYAVSQQRPFTDAKRALKENPVWVTLDSIAGNTTSQLKSLNFDEVETVGERIWKWVASILDSEEFQQRIQIIQDMIDDLPEVSK